MIPDLKLQNTAFDDIRLTFLSFEFYSDRTEMRKKLEDETNRRTKEQNNHHVVSERITNLEKEKRDLADRLKKENENMEKLKKSNAELSIAKTASGKLLCKKKI